MTSTIREIMSKDHRYCDNEFIAIIQLVSDSDWDKATSMINTLTDDINVHFELEEQLLFIAFENTTGSMHGPTSVMREEHQQIRQLLEQLSDLASGKDAAQTHAQIETLMIFLQQHNMKEENILYPLIDENCTFSHEQLDSIHKTMRNRAA